MTFLTDVERFNFKSAPHFDIYMCGFEPDLFMEIHFAEFEILGQKHVEGAVDKRKAEFLAGRICAKSSLQSLGVYENVGRSVNRSPIWPEGIVGSISHTSNLAMAITLPSETVNYVGIDCEVMIEEHRARELSSSILVDSELMDSLTSPLPFPEFFTLCFSAKESLFKALHPTVGKFFGFEAARLVSLTPETGEFCLVLNEDLNDVYQKGTCFDGHYHNKNGVISTLVVG